MDRAADCDVLGFLQGMGLGLRLADEGERLIVNGLKTISPEKAAQARELCRRHKSELCAALAATKGQGEAAQSEAPVPTPWTQRDYYPLRRRYTHPDQIGKVLEAWNIRLEVDGDDFYVTEKARLALLPDLFIFFKANGPLINLYLREQPGNRGESHA